MRLRCGECHVWREVTVTNRVAERFDLGSTAGRT